MPCAPGLPCPFFMFWQLCVALGEADGEGVAVLADAALTAVVPVVSDVVDVFTDDVVGAEWLVAALATARLPPNPTPSAPAPTAVPIMILPSLALNESHDHSSTAFGCSQMKLKQAIQDAQAAQK